MYRRSFNLSKIYLPIKGGIFIFARRHKLDDVTGDNDSQTRHLSLAGRRVHIGFRTFQMSFIEPREGESMTLRLFVIAL